MRKVSSVVVIAVLLTIISAPTYAAVHPAPPRTSLTRALLVWLQSRISPPLPAPAPAPEPATSEKRTTS